MIQKIKEEDFEKLSQGDRIEFMLRLKNVKENSGGGNSWSIVKFTCILLGFLLLLAVSSYSVRETLFVSVMELISSIIRILPIFLLLAFLADVVSFYVSNKKQKELINKFFKITPTKIEAKNKDGRKK